MYQNLRTFYLHMLYTMNYVQLQLQLQFLFAYLLMVGVAGIIPSCYDSSALVFLVGHPTIIAVGLMLLLQFNP